MGEELEKNKKIIEELKKEKEEALRYCHRMKAMNKDLEKEVNEMECKLLDKQNIIDQMNDHCAEMEEERDLFASHLEEFIMQKHASIDANPINEKGKAEAIQKSQESFLDSILLNGNLSLILIGFYDVMTGMMTSETNGFNEKLIGNDRSMIDLNECKMKKEEKKSPVQMQRKHSPTLCALGYSFKMSMDIVPNGEMNTQTAAPWITSDHKLKHLELQQAMCSRQNHGCDSHEMDANQKKKRGEMLYIACNPCTYSSCSIYF